MSRYFKSDITGLEIAANDHKKLAMTVTIHSSYLNEPIEYRRVWDMTQAEYDALIPDAITMKNAIQDAAVAFLNAVENT